MWWCKTKYLGDTALRGTSSPISWMHALVRGLLHRGCALCRCMCMRVDGEKQLYDGGAAGDEKEYCAAGALEENSLHTHTKPYKTIYRHTRRGFQHFGLPHYMVPSPTPRTNFQKTWLLKKIITETADSACPGLPCKLECKARARPAGWPI